MEKLTEEELKWIETVLVAGPILPVEVSRDEYTNVISYLVTTGFITGMIDELLDSRNN